MKTLKNYSMMIALAALAISCSGDDDRVAVAPDLSKHTNLISKQTEGTIVTTYFYDSNNVIKKISRTGGILNGNTYTPYDQEFTFSSSGKLLETNYSNTQSGGMITHSKVRYNYNNDGSVQNTRFYYVSSATQNETLITTSDFTYVNDQVMVYSHQLDTNDRSRTEYSYDANGNMIEAKSYTVNDANPNGVYSGNAVYGNFDTFKTPTSSLPESFNFPNTNTNNYGIVLYNGSSGNRVYTYEYNGDGYPTKRTDVAGNVVSYEYRRL